MGDGAAALGPGVLCWERVHPVLTAAVRKLNAIIEEYSQNGWSACAATGVGRHQKFSGCAGCAAMVNRGTPLSAGLGKGHCAESHWHVTMSVNVEV